MSAGSADATRRVAAAGRRVVVIGAGFAGLSAAVRLRAHGADVRVLEREDLPGGRARSLSLGGIDVDPCATLLSGSDTAVCSLLESLEQPDELERWPAGSVCRADAGGALFPLSSLRPRAGRPPAGVTRRDALRCVRMDRLAARYARLLDPRRPESAAVLDDRSVEEWARLYFGNSVLTAWMSPWLAAATQGDEAEASRLTFLLQYAASRGRASASLRAGPGALAGALARRVPTQFGTVVESVEPTPRGGFALHVCAGGERRSLEADAVVLALPPSAVLACAAAVLRTAEKDHFAGVRLRPALSMALITRDSVAPPVRRIVAEGSDRALRTLQFHAAGADARASSVLVAIASAAFAAGAADAGDDVVIRRLLAEGERYAPRSFREVQSARVVRFAEGLPRFGVGDYRALGRLRKVEDAERERGRRLAFAGDHLLGPSLEAAVESGFRAADALAASLAQP